MSFNRLRQSGLQGAMLIALTYIYFLIFAQFAFLKRLAFLGVVDANLKAVMAAMAFGGILASLLTPRLKQYPSPTLRLRIGLLISGAAAFLSLLPLNFAGSIAVAALIGIGLGILTVTLVTHLRHWTGNGNALMAVGFGTGLGYFVCNIPGFFDASPTVQTSSAGILCLLGVGVSCFPTPCQPNVILNARRSSSPFVIVVACLTALVWLDSAAFFIIQNNSSLRANTWQGHAHLLTNGALHFSAAVVCAWLLQKRSLWLLLASSFLALSVACLLLQHPARATLASLFYPVGVSLYSVALVAYPSLLAPAQSALERGRQAGWIYSIAGWMGSAMGIGMAQNLGQVPTTFVLVAGIVVLAPGWIKAFRLRIREIALTACVAVVALVVYRLSLPPHASPTPTQIERGRQVYISEGCISCHSQYVRPNSPDVLMWGPTESLNDLRRQTPPLIGNRRQGPDLAEVGGRRSPLWLKAHFFGPAEVTGVSVMPAYGFLFLDGRGDDLVAYLASLRTSGTAEHWEAEKHWQPSAWALAHADPATGKALFVRFCSTCHGPQGHTRTQWQASFQHIPEDLTVGVPLSSIAGFSSEPQLRLAQIAKYGIPNTDMPGHEYLSDADIASLSLWLSENLRQPKHKP